MHNKVVVNDKVGGCDEHCEVNSQGRCKIVTMVTLKRKVKAKVNYEKGGQVFGNKVKIKTKGSESKYT